jgi:enoyl-CoA hydratase/carnithine racemase
MNDRTPAPFAEGEVLREDRGGIALITLNRPRHYNAFSHELLAQARAMLAAIAGDERVRVVVITGSGKAFCTGCDLKQMRADYREDFIASVFRSCSLMMQDLRSLPQPVIAAVNGVTTAAGCELVAACDLAVAADNARFAVSGINLGLFCSTPAVPLSRNIGRKRALEMLFSGEFIDAETALDWGLVNRVTPADRLMEGVTELANNLMSKPPRALALGKALFYRQLEQPYTAAYEDACRTITQNMLDPVAAEGVDAFMQKRSPNWSA